MAPELLSIPGLDGYFADPANGEIWSAKGKTPRVLAGGVSRGYRIYSLMIDGRTTMRSGHRLVATSAFGPCPDGMECCHINGVRGDNRAVNLKWASASENNGIDKERTGSLVFGEFHHNSKLTRSSVDEIRALRSGGATLLSIAIAYGVAEGTVSKIVRGEAWTR